jgi:hypothetical protein
MAGAVLFLAVTLFTGCETSNGGSQTSVYYGVGFYDPWYYGDADYDTDIVVTPPDRDRPQVSHPIAPGGGGPSRPAQMPSIPSGPRVAPRGGGGRR